MKIAIIVAMKDELPIDKIKKQITKQKTIFGYEFLEIKNKKQNLILAYSKIGKANASACTSLLLNEYKPDIIINIGCAGCVDKDINIFDNILVDKYYYTDVDATKFGYELGQVPQEDKYYQFDSKLNKKVQSILKEMNLKIKNVGSSDSFITNENFKKYSNLEKLSCVDMEATSIAQVVSKTKTKLISIKIIVDSIYKEIESKEKWYEDLYKIQQNLIDMIMKLTEELYETYK